MNDVLKGMVAASTQSKKPSPGPIAAGKVLSINIASRKAEKKRPIAKAALKAGRGIAGDAHAGEPHRQVSLLAIESIQRLLKPGIHLQPGDFAENITCQGLPLANLMIGDYLRIGSDVLLEICQIGKECHDWCRIREQIGDCVMPREGIFARVIVGGEITAGDDIVAVPCTDKVNTDVASRQSVE